MTFSNFFGIIIQIMFKGRLTGVSDYEMVFNSTALWLRLFLTNKGGDLNKQISLQKDSDLHR